MRSPIYPKSSLILHTGKITECCSFSAVGWEHFLSFPAHLRHTQYLSSLKYQHLHSQQSFTRERFPESSQELWLRRISGSFFPWSIQGWSTTVFADSIAGGHVISVLRCQAIDWYWRRKSSSGHTHLMMALLKPYAGKSGGIVGDDVSKSDRLGE